MCNFRAIDLLIQKRCKQNRINNSHFVQLYANAKLHHKIKDSIDIIVGEINSFATKHFKQRPLPNNGCEQMSAFEGVDCDYFCVLLVFVSVVFSVVSRICFRLKQTIERKIKALIKGRR